MYRFVALCAALLAAASAQEYDCVMVDKKSFTVKCEGLGKEFDMSGLGSLYASYQDQQTSNTYFFNILNGGLPTSVTDGQGNTCGSVKAGTIIEQKADQCYNICNIGHPSSIVYTYNPDDGSSMSAVFAGGDDGRSCEILFNCDPQGVGTNSFTFTREDQDKKLYLTSVQCPDMCPENGKAIPKSSAKSSAGGWIFVGLLLGAMFIYFIGGMMFMKFGRNASSTTEIVGGPHADFWISFPGLVKDGARFTVAKVTCRESAYSKL